MRKIALVFVIITAVSCSTQKTTEARVTVTDTALSDVPPNRLTDSLPACIRNMIAFFSAETVQNPPRKIFSYHYKGQTVYYVPPVCCDQYSNLYDKECVLLGHPDGGFTGRGDGKFPDFGKAATNAKLVWADKRK